MSHFLGYNFNPWAKPLARALSQSDYEVLHIHNINSTIMLSPLLKGLHGPTVCHIHDHWPICYRGILYDVNHGAPCNAIQTSCCFDPGRRIVGRANLALRAKLLQRFEHDVSAFISPSNYMKKVLTERGFSTPGKIRVVRLGIDLNQVLVPTGLRPLQFTFAGRLVYYKNPQFIVRLLRRDKLPSEATLRLIGDGPERAALLAAVSRCKEGRLRINGHVPRPYVLDALGHSRALLMPSIVPENSPLVIVEALSAGTPVLCSPLGGAQELVNDSRAGEVLPLANIEQWEDELTSLAEEDHFSTLSERASVYAQNNLDIAKTGAAMAAVYDELAG
jgi:glycosyltransferase involved in cell wall biosynthesis